MPLPDTLPDLAGAGYRHCGASRCADCGGRIEWFLTKKNRKMPFSLKQDIVVGEDAIYAKPSMTRYEPHFAVCRRKR